MKRITQIFLASLIIVKMALGSIFVYWVEFDPLFMETTAIAAEEVKEDQRTKQDRESKEDNVETTEQSGKMAAEEEEIDLDFLITRKAELEKEKEGLEKKKAELLAIQEEINNKIVVLTQLRNEIRSEMTRKKTFEDKKVKHLIKAYSAMKPKSAASLIEKLEMEFALELLSRMKGDIVGKILTYVNVEKAAKISEALLTDDKS